MSTVTLVLFGLVALVAAFVGYVATRPDAFRIERSQTVRANADAVFARINDLRQYAQKVAPLYQAAKGGAAAGK